jgi:predicted nucleic acid-binding protein
LFVVALINQRDQHHQRAQELAQAYQGRSFLTTDVVLLEIGNGLARMFRMVDCVSFVVMKNEGVHEALTFDRNFVQAGFRALMRP